MKRVMIGALAMLFAISVLTGGGCTGGKSAGTKAQHAIAKQDVADINEQLKELRQAEPLPHFHDSAALRVQDAYYTADADPNKIWYVALVGLDGTPYMQLTTRGAPQPAGDQVTNPVQQYCAGGSSGEKNCDTIGLPEPNGVHQGLDNSGYVAILTTGAVVRLPANAVISDQPFKLTSPVHLSVNESAAISATDESKTENGLVPKGSGTRQK